MKTYSLGIDPDLHTLSAALVSAENGKAKLEGIWTAKAVGSVKEEAVGDIIEAMSQRGGVRDIRDAVTGVAHLANYGKPLVTIEAQNVAYTGKTNAARPQDLINLAQVAGGCLALFGGNLVLPSEWKKQMPKKIVQGRCLSALGLKYRLMGGAAMKNQYCVPLDYSEFDKTGNLNPGDWKDAGDSVAIAYWRLKKEKHIR